jgi:hypothetical protein
MLWALVFLVRVAVAATLLLGGCKGKDGEPGLAGPAGPAGPALIGDLSGFATPYDETGPSASKAGTVVSIDNQTPALTSVTDANGRFQFAALKSGTYNLTYTRPGYGTMKRFGVTHIGGDNATFLGNQGLAAVVTTNIVSLIVTSPQGGYNDYILTLSAPATLQSRFNTYVGATASVNASNYLFYYTSGATIGSSRVTGSLYRSTLNAYGLSSGSTAYAVSYPASNYNFSYVDAISGLTVNPSLGAPSSVQAFIVP